MASKQSGDNPYKDLFVGASGVNATNQQQQQQQNGQQQNVSKEERIQQFVEEARAELEEGALMNQGQNQNQNNQTNNR